MGKSSSSQANTTRRSILQKATAVAGLGIGGGLLGASEAFACHLYVSPRDGAKGCGAFRRDRNDGTGSDASNEPSVQTSAQTAEPSPPPASGGRLRDAPRPVLVHLVNFGLKGPHAGLRGGRGLMTRAAFIPPGQHARAINGRMYFDHSDAGIEAGAQQVARTIRQLNSRFGMFDVEHYNSVNVPARVGYNPSVDGQLAARYDATARGPLREEAARYHTRLVGRVRQLLSNQSVELGEYNVPRFINWYHRYNGAEKSRVANTEARDLTSLLPLLSFTGPQAQLLVDQRMCNDIQSGRITDDMLIEWHAESVRVRRRALGNNARIMPTIWPRLFGLGGARLPNGSAALRPGFMYRFCNALLDAGARGFVCWTPSSDGNLSKSDQQAMSRSWEEVVRVCRERGFQAIT